MRQRYLLGLVLFVACTAVALTAWGAQPENKGPAAAAAVVWEYKSFQRTVYSGGLDTQMNELGGQGWEFCGAHSTTMTPDDVPTPTTVYVFRRAKAAGGK